MRSLLALSIFGAFATVCSTNVKVNFLFKRKMWSSDDEQWKDGQDVEKAEIEISDKELIYNIDESLQKANRACERLLFATQVQELMIVPALNVKTKLGTRPSNEDPLELVVVHPENDAEITKLGFHEAQNVSISINIAVKWEPTQSSPHTAPSVAHSATHAAATVASNRAASSPPNESLMEFVSLNVAYKQLKDALDIALPNSTHPVYLTEIRIPLLMVAYGVPYVRMPPHPSHETFYSKVPLTLVRGSIESEEHSTRVNVVIGRQEPGKIGVDTLYPPRNESANPDFNSLLPIKYLSFYASPSEYNIEKVIETKVETLLTEVFGEGKMEILKVYDTTPEEWKDGGGDSDTASEKSHHPSETGSETEYETSLSSLLPGKMRWGVGVQELPKK